MKRIEEHQLGTVFRSNWDLEELVLEEKGKPGRKNPKQERELTINSTHI